MSIKKGDTVKVKNSLSGRHFKVVDKMGQLIIGTPDDGPQVKIGLAQANLVVISKAP